MKKTDIGVIAFMYAVCGYFYSQTLQLKADSQTYPKFTIILLFGLTTLYLVEMIIAAKRHGVESGVDEVFKDFVPAQFWSVNQPWNIQLSYCGTTGQAGSS